MKLFKMMMTGVVFATSLTMLAVDYTIVDSM